VAGLVVGLLALGALGTAAVSATRSETPLASAHAIREADHSNAYYACLTAQAHALVRPDDVVFLGEANLDRWVTVIKAMGGWAHMAMRQSAASVAILLEHPAHGPSCAGETLVSIRRETHGGVRFRSGRQSSP
jgi:hypothetical protein